MIRRLLCPVLGHEDDGGTNHYDIPTRPDLVPDEYMYGGFVETTWYRCRHCRTLLETELGHDPDEPIEHPFLPGQTIDPIDT